MTASTSGGDPLDLVIGRVVKPHGVRGEVVVEVRTDSPDERFVAGAVLGCRHGDGTARGLTVINARPHSGRLLVSFEGVADRESAEELRNARLTVDTAGLPEPTDPEEFYDYQLVGLRVVATADPGTTLGTIGEVVHTSGGDLLAVRKPEGGEALVPFVHDIVPEVDLSGGRVLIAPPEGLLE